MNPPTPRGVKSITALRRGLDVLVAIQQSSAASLAELHRQTGWPKASLLRILKTLQEAGWVERNALESRYVALPAAGESGPVVAWRARLSGLAVPARQALQRRVPWPTDLAVRDGTAMLILDAHRPINGLSVNYRVLGFRPRMLLSSLGRCHLAFCPDDERQAILAALGRSPDPVDRAALRPQAITRMVTAAQAQGYAARDPSAAGSDSPERFAAIAVPVHCAGRLIACLSCAWLPTVRSEQQIVSAHLADLQAAARAIESRLAQAGAQVLAGKA